MSLLATEIAQCVLETGHPAQSGYNTHGKYNYSTRDDIYAVCRAVFAKRGLAVVPSLELVSHERVHDSSRGAAQYRAIVRLKLSFQHAQHGEQVTHWIGESIGGDDKVIQSAGTQAIRFALTSLLMLMDGSDEQLHHAAGTQTGETRAVQAPPTEPSALENFNACMSSIGITDEEATKFGAYIADTEQKPSLAKVDPHRLQGYVNKLLGMAPAEAAERVRAKI